MQTHIEIGKTSEVREKLILNPKLKLRDELREVMRFNGREVDYGFRHLTMGMAIPKELLIPMQK